MLPPQMTGIQRGLAAGDESGYPGYIRAAFGVDAEWKEEGHCTRQHRNGSLFWWWQIGPGEYRAGHSGKKWIGMAEMICRGCPVQWDCFRYAIEVDEYYTWAISEKRRRELQDWYGDEQLGRYIDIAEETGTSLIVMYERLVESRHARAQDSSPDLERSAAAS